MATQTLTRPVGSARPGAVRQQPKQAQPKPVRPFPVTVRAARPVAREQVRPSMRVASPVSGGSRASRGSAASETSAASERSAASAVSGVSVPQQLTARTTTYAASSLPVASLPVTTLPASGYPKRTTRPGLRITRRGRLALVLALALTMAALMIGAVLQLGTPAQAAPDGSTGAVTRSVVVAPGETLWDIARDVRPGADPRETVHRIQELNGLTTVTVWAGQPLIVPA